MAYYYEEEASVPPIDTPHVGHFDFGCSQNTDRHTAHT